MKMYNEHDTYKTISFLKSTVQTELSKVKNYLNIDTDLHMVTFFGDCSYDGHGMLIKGKPYVFFDLNAIIPRIDFYNFNVFATHEILRSEEHTSELQSRGHLVCRLLLEKKKNQINTLTSLN